jgi:hypothetical protein
MANLEGMFQQEGHDLEPLSKELGDQAIAVLEQGRGLYPAVMLQAHEEGKITVTESEHKDILAQLERDAGPEQPYS